MLHPRRNIIATLLWALALSFPAQAKEITTDYDDKAASILTYFTIGKDDAPLTNVTNEQFRQHAEELSNGGYRVLALPEIVKAFRKGTPLPSRTIAITFDGADKSALAAARILVEKKLPFTVFIPADKVRQKDSSFMDWRDLRALKETGFATFGAQPGNNKLLTQSGESEIRRQINNSVSIIRSELGVEPIFFAYPYGEYDQRYEKIVRSMKFQAAFGQQSGVAYAGSDLYALPRFVLTEQFADMDRFQMMTNALPFPVEDMSPASPHMAKPNTPIGFTLPQSLMPLRKKLSCFSLQDKKPLIELIGNRVEIRVRDQEEKMRINCTLPYREGPEEEVRWRWFGILAIANPLAADSAETGEADEFLSPE
jgi:peptidoglycan/xylan/chitin deacetylase (PgdA/CDA1 family)